jgi:hypothetical protein
MKRDLIMIVGGQGCGKSVWTKEYVRSVSRLLVSDPMASFPGVDFMTDPADWWPKIERGELKEFRFGTHIKEELALFGHMAFGAKDCTLVIEECALMFPRGADLDEWAKRLVFMGRHARVNLLLVAQRAVKIPLDVRSQATRIISFRQIDPNDLKALEEVMGNGMDGEEIRALPELHCVDWTPGSLKRYSVRP